MTLNDKIQIDNLKSNPNLYPANKVLVFGAGDGDFQVHAEASDVAVGEIALYRTIIDRTLKTAQECQYLANQILIKEKQEVKNCRFFQY